MTEFNFELKEAKKESVPPLIALWGASGSGKTYTALLLARGLVGPKGKIAVIDTENGRAKFYSDLVDGWFHLDLQPPFTTEKYSAAFKFCEEKGANVIIVDSMSHVWEGEGGVLDKAEDIGGFGLQKFKKPKMDYKRMLNNLIRSPIPVIFNLRAKEAVQQIGSGKDMKIVNKGLQPIVEKNFIFEMTVSLNMIKDGKFDIANSKIPAPLKSKIKEGMTIDSSVGMAIAEWAGSGVQIDEETIKLKRDGKDAALKGEEEYVKWGKSLTESQRAKVSIYIKDWLNDAKEADKTKNEQTQVEQEEWEMA